MPRGKHLSADIKERIVNLYRSGEKQVNIARSFNINKSIVSRIIRQYRVFDDVSVKKKSGRPRKTTPYQDKRILRYAKNEPFLGSSRIKRRISEELGVEVSSRTVRGRLLEGNLLGRRPAKKPLLSKKNRRARLKFAQTHVHWVEHDWKKIIWSDESKFCLIKSDGINYVRRPKNQRFNPKYTCPTVKHGGGSVMVWGCFSGFGIGPLHKIEGNMDRFQYKDILENQMVPYADEIMPLRHQFQQDNDPKHTSRFVKQWFVRERINVLEWPSQSPDLNPIENLWEILDSKIRGKQYRNNVELFEALREAWKNMDPMIITKLIRSMPKRCQGIIKNNGYFLKY